MRSTTCAGRAPKSVLTTQQLASIAIPTMFIWGTDAPYLSAERARPAIVQIPGATLHEVPGGHGPWLVDPERSADLIQTHITSVTTRPPMRRTSRRRGFGLRV